MSYLWDGYSVDLTYCLAEKEFSPYAECLSVHSREREVNGLFRFGHIFSRLERHREGKDGEKEAVSLLFHILANYDFLSGVTKQDISMGMQEEMILQEYYGSRIRTLYGKLARHQKYVVLKYMEKRRVSQGRKGYAFEAACELLGGILYYSCKSRCLLIFIPAARGDKSGEDGGCTCEEVYELWKDLFLDYWMEIEPVWRRHFGIIGCDSTMRIGNLQIL